MKLFNSSTKELVELPKAGRITIYNCGPTVYNHIHIGNARPLIIFDVLNRYLMSIHGIQVAYTQNITDVDDKIINAAKLENVNELELSRRYTQAYKDLFKLLNIREMHMPLVSDHIQEIEDYIEELISKGAAYESNGDVYFDITKAKDYGHISHQKPEELLEGVRKENKENKKNPLDFVLWKKTNEGINWSSPWSDGRPGWHTECCVLINKYMGDHVTIHGGGVDLKFPHHENENAQNRVMCGKDIADIWVHVGHVNVDGAKMAKSAGNYIFVKDLIDNKTANGLRWFFYQSKYEQPINFSKEAFDAACVEVENVIKALTVAKTYNIAYDVYFYEIVAASDEFNKCLDDDLNLPNAITVLLGQIKQLNTLVREKKWSESNKLCCVVARELGMLGIRYDFIADYQSNLDLIKKWRAAMDAKDFNKSDEYRSALLAKGLL